MRKKPKFSYIIELIGEDILTYMVYLFNNIKNYIETGIYIVKKVVA